MSEAGSLQAQFEQYQADGFMMITAMDGDATEDLLGWADEYGITHPVIGDAAGEFFWTYSKTSSWPMKVLINRGVVLESIDDMADAAEIEALLYPE
ncbi:MAG: hypothetical protein Q8P41_01025 [Pseudomonadota bacterium]|nr:hypothetical protein [Pseudomonadota bacterium]